MNNDKIEECRIQNCFLLRQLLVTLLTVLSGGIVGLFFTQSSITKYFFIMLGVFFLYVFGVEFHKNNVELNGYLYKRRAKQ